MLPVRRWARDNTYLPSNSDISKRVGVNTAFARTCFKKYSISFLMISRLIDIALVVIWLLMFKGCRIIGTSKIEFFNFSGNERVTDSSFELKSITRTINQTLQVIVVFLSHFLFLWLSVSFQLHALVWLGCMDLNSTDFFFPYQIHWNAANISEKFGCT